MATEQVAEQKTNIETLKKTLEELKTAVIKLKKEYEWNEVYNVAEDIIAYIDRKIERFAFKLLPRNSDEMYVVYISGATDYVSYRFKPETSLRQLTEHFFGDTEILPKMVRILVIKVIRAVDEVVDKIIGLEQKVEELRQKVRDLESKLEPEGEDL